MNVKVRLLSSANGAYACITTETQTFDVRLAEGKPATVSLRESALELRQKAERLLAQAALIEAAEQLL